MAQSEYLCLERRLRAKPPEEHPPDQAEQVPHRAFIGAAPLVVGGCLLTGGYGSAIGASIGALIIGFAQIGIIFANWDSNWYFTFLGVILFLAVGVNTLVRRRAMAARR